MKNTFQDQVNALLYDRALGISLSYHLSDYENLSNDAVMFAVETGNTDIYTPWEKFEDDENLYFHIENLANTIYESFKQIRGAQ